MKFKLVRYIGDGKSVVADIKTESLSGTVYKDGDRIDVRVNSYFEGMKPAAAKKELIRLFKSLPVEAKPGDYEDGK